MTPQIDDNFKVSIKIIYFDLKIQSLNSFAIQFWYKIYFYYFLVPSLKEQTEKSLNSSIREKKSVLTPILAK